MIKCSKCGIEKDDEEFRGRHNKDCTRIWRGTICKKCEQAKNKEYWKTYMRKKSSKYKKSALDEYAKRAHELHISYGQLVYLVDRGEEYV